MAIQYFHLQTTLCRYTEGFEKNVHIYKNKVDIFEFLPDISLNTEEYVHVSSTVFCLNGSRCPPDGDLTYLNTQITCLPSCGH